MNGVYSQRVQGFQQTVMEGTGLVTGGLFFLLFPSRPCSADLSVVNCQAILSIVEMRQFFFSKQALIDPYDSGAIQDLWHFLRFD